MNARILLKTTTWNMLNQARAGKTDTRMSFQKLMVINNNMYTTDGHIAVKVEYQYIAIQSDTNTIENGVYDIGLVEKHSKEYTQVRIFKDTNHDIIGSLPSFFEPFINLDTNIDCMKVTTIDLNCSTKDLDRAYTLLICYAFQPIDKLNPSQQNEINRNKGIGLSISLILAKKIKGFIGEMYFNKEKSQYYFKNDEIQIIILPLTV